MFGNLTPKYFLIDSLLKAFPDTPFGWVIPELRHIQNELGLYIQFTISYTSNIHPLDFVNEGKNAERAMHMFEGNPQIKIPTINWDLSTKKILTMEYIDGIKINDIEALDEAKIDKHKVAEILINMFSTQVFEHGFVHSDLHPGNLFVRRKDNRQLQLVLLDHGLYRELPEDVRLNYCHLWKALVMRNPEEIKQYAQQLGAGDYYEILAVMLTYRTTTRYARCNN